MQLQRTAEPPPDRPTLAASSARAHLADAVTALAGADDDPAGASAVEQLHAAMQAVDDYLGVCFDRARGGRAEPQGAARLLDRLGI